MLERPERPAALLLTRLHRLLCLPFVVLSLLELFSFLPLRKNFSWIYYYLAFADKQGTSKTEAFIAPPLCLHKVCTSPGGGGARDGDLSCFTSLWLIKARHIPAPSFVLSTRQVQELSICTPLEHDDISSFGSACALGWGLVGDAPPADKGNIDVD